MVCIALQSLQEATDCMGLGDFCRKIAMPDVLASLPLDTCLSACPRVLKHMEYYPTIVRLQRFVAIVGRLKGRLDEGSSIWETLIILETSFAGLKLDRAMLSTPGHKVHGTLFAVYVSQGSLYMV